MKKLLRYALQLALVLALVVGIRTWQQRDLPSGEAPLLSGRDLRGQSVSLQDFRGRPLLLHFWASWCGVCRMEQGSIDAIARDWPVLSIALQSGEAEAVADYLRTQDLDFRTLPDPEGRLGSQYGVRGVPATFVLDEDGRIRFAELGYSTEFGLRARLRWASVF